MRSVTNIIEGPEEERRMSTGLYLIRSICCKKCMAELGWKYVRSCDDSQRYKEGKYILESTRLLLHLTEC